jgi:nicotinamidase-related amidase
MKTLIVIDMQNDFIYGPLGTPEARAIVSKVKKKIEEYSSRDDAVVFTRDTHSRNYLDTNEGKYLPVEHCILGTDGWNIYDELYFAKHSQSQLKLPSVVNKSTFGFTHWSIYPFIYEAKEIELVGVCTDICVISNAMILKALCPEIPIIVDASCCAGTTPESHRNALEVMKKCQIEIIGEEMNSDIS